MVYRDRHPGSFLRKNHPQVGRVADLVSLVYDNIDNYIDDDDVLVKFQNIPSAGIAYRIVKCRTFMGNFKQSVVWTAKSEFFFRGLTKVEMERNYEEFNQQLVYFNLLKGDGFVGDDISDAEHFFTSAILACTGGLFYGPVIEFLASGSWDVVLPLVIDIKNGSIWSDDKSRWKRIKSNWQQFMGIDKLGAQYGIFLMTGQDINDM